MIVVTIARKPFGGTVASNVIETGIGGLNIDACRIAAEGGSPSIERRKHGFTPYNGPCWKEIKSRSTYSDPRAGEVDGRWPSNLVLQHADGCVRLGTKKAAPVTHYRPKPVKAGHSDGSIQFTRKPVGWQKASYTGSDGLEEIENWSCVEDCAVKDLDSSSGPCPSAYRENPSKTRNIFLYEHYKATMKGERGYKDAGGASRYFKQVQALFLEVPDEG